MIFVLFFIFFFLVFCIISILSKYINFGYMFGRNWKAEDSLDWFLEYDDPYASRIFIVFSLIVSVFLSFGLRCYVEVILKLILFLIIFFIVLLFIWLTIEIVTRYVNFGAIFGMDWKNHAEYHCLGSFSERYYMYSETYVHNVFLAISMIITALSGFGLSFWLYGCY